ncbi:hypothetical protein AVEN_244773-1 [Araneus ventricosus]|uniref:Uncharacterized protein n=1 Tax=Araneus ventricosus TaxID=182803 RepID=A0A4Y2BT33_ARAVE|nr:hypothetical protein AVEN_244773-1 [Araneus ventricosus]
MLIDLMCVDLLKRLWSYVCSGIWKAGELRAIESTVTVVISDLLTACVPKSESVVELLLVNCCLFALLICTRSIVPVTCASCYPE